MSDWKSKAQGCLAPPLAGFSFVAIIALTQGASVVASWPLAARLCFAFLLAGLNTLWVSDGEHRRRVGGMFFYLTVLGTVVSLGGRVGLEATWQRWLAGIVLSFPFWFLSAVNTPGRWKNWWDARRARRHAK